MCVESDFRAFRHIHNRFTMLSCPPSRRLRVVLGHMRPAVAAAKPKPMPTQLLDRRVLDDASNSLALTFKLPDGVSTLGLEAGEHVIPRVRDETERKGFLERKYTPISLDDEGQVEVAIKVYHQDHTHNGIHYDNGGKMTLALENLAIGDALEIAGPTGNLKYVGGGPKNDKDVC